MKYFLMLLLCMVVGKIDARCRNHQHHQNLNTIPTKQVDPKTKEVSTVPKATYEYECGIKSDEFSQFNATGYCNYCGCILTQHDLFEAIDKQKQPVRPQTTTPQTKK
jgi:hypothetical protein